MPWQVFDKTVPSKLLQPTLTLQKSGVLSLNSASYEALLRPSAVELLFDPDAERMGLRNVDSRLPHAYTVRQHGGSRTWVVTVQRFAHFHGIDLTTSRRYPALVEGDILVIDLKGKPIV